MRQVSGTCILPTLGTTSYPLYKYQVAKNRLRALSSLGHLAHSISLYIMYINVCLGGRSTSRVPRFTSHTQDARKEVFGV